ncbi:MAG TPA: hypothetical protein EYM65_12765 [Dehalococcoidia bacterium]|nr:hypothetical protein [Dehalococcoidia bacterium]
MAVCWLFPGQTVSINAPCLDCGEPMALEMKDGQVLSADPAGIFGYTPEALGGPPDGRPHR